MGMLAKKANSPCVNRSTGEGRGNGDDDEHYDLLKYLIVPDHVTFFASGIHVR